MEQHGIHTEEKERVIASGDGTVEPLGKTLMDFFAVIIKWRRFLMRFVLGATVITTIVAALLMPKWYKSTASVFPAEQTSLSPIWAESRRFSSRFPEADQKD